MAVVKIVNFNAGINKSYIRATLDAPIASSESSIGLVPEQPIRKSINAILTNEAKQLIPFLLAHKAIDRVYIIATNTISVRLLEKRSKGIVMRYIKVKAAEINTSAVYAAA